MEVKEVGWPIEVINWVKMFEKCWCPTLPVPSDGGLGSECVNREKFMQEKNSIYDKKNAIKMR